MQHSGIALKGSLPWTRSCFVCGEENAHGLHVRSAVEDGRVIFEYITRSSDAGYKEIVHGGILMALADEAMTWAAVVALRKMCVAAEVCVRLRAPVRVGEKIRVEAWPVRTGARLCCVKAAISGAAGDERAVAEGKYMPMPPSLMALAQKDFVSAPGCIALEELVGSR